MQLSAAAYVGRVGGLAVALGIGAAILSAPGLAAAEGTDTSPSDTSSNSAPAAGTTKTPDTGKSDTGKSDTGKSDTGKSDSDKSDTDTDAGSASAGSEDDGSGDGPDDPDRDAPDDAEADPDADTDDGADADADVDTAESVSAEPDPTGQRAPAVKRDGKSKRVAAVSGEVDVYVAAVQPSPAASADSAPQADIWSPAAVPATVTVTAAAPAPTLTLTVITVEQPVANTIADTAPAVEEPAPTEVATLARPLAALSDLLPGDSPDGPVQSPLDWTAAAVARRELADPQAEVRDLTPATVANQETAQTPAVAIEQIAPLAWLQRIPIIGPLVVTPIVYLIHQIPFLGDIVHPLIGYPVRHGLAADVPVSRDVKVISFDGTPIYVHFMPATGLKAGEQAPTVLNGPGLIMPGATTLNGSVFDLFAADTFGQLSIGMLRRNGYNVVTWDPRGEWNSGGVLELNLPGAEGRDMSAIIDWIATQPEALLDDEAARDPRLGMVGVSYGGAIQLVTAARDHRVDAIVPAITYNSLTTALYPNQAFKGTWAGLLSAGMMLIGNHVNPRIYPAAIEGLLTTDISPEDLALLDERSPGGTTDLISLITAPTLLIQGTVDTVFSLQEAHETAMTLLGNGVPTKVVWFCGGHGLCANNILDLRDGVLIQQRSLQWLDRYVKGNTDALTGPQFEWVDQRGRWYSSDTYPLAPTSSIVASKTDTRLNLLPFLAGSGPFLGVLPFVESWAPNAINVRTARAENTTYLVGAPTLTMTYSGTGDARHVYAQVVDNSTGMVLGFQATPIPVTLDGGVHTVTVDLAPIAHTLRPGRSVTVQLVASAINYPSLRAWGQLDVASVEVSLPTVDPAAVTVSSV